MPTRREQVNDVMQRGSPLPDGAVIKVVYDKGEGPAATVNGSMKAWNQDGYLHLLVGGRSFCVPHSRIFHIDGT